MANYWILEKQYVHKLFKVLVPRFQNLDVSYTRMYKAPIDYPGYERPRAVIELRGHPFPPLVPDMAQNKNLIHNVLLAEARKEFRQKKYAEMAATMAPTTLSNTEAEQSNQNASQVEGERNETDEVDDTTEKKM